MAQGVQNWSKWLVVFWFSNQTDQIVSSKNLPKIFWLKSLGTPNLDTCLHLASLGLTQKWSQAELIWTKSGLPIRLTKSDDKMKLGTKKFRRSKKYEHFSKKKGSCWSIFSKNGSPKKCWAVGCLRNSTLLEVDWTHPVVFATSCTGPTSNPCPSCFSWVLSLAVPRSLLA